MQAPSQPEPQLRLGHLLIWIVGCALGFAAYRELLTAPFQPRFRPLVLGYNLGMGTTLGTILAGSGLLAFRRWRGDLSYPSLPGHWLLLFGLAAALADGAAIIAYIGCARQDPSFPEPAFWVHLREADNPTWPGFYHQTVGWGLGAVVALVFLCRLRGRLARPWLAVFLVALIASATLAGLKLITFIHLLITNRLVEYTAWCRRSVQLFAGFLLLGALAILAALAWDMRTRARTDGLHRLGIAVWLAIAAVQVVTCVIFFNML
jgi:hypothetical protein